MGSILDNEGNEFTYETKFVILVRTDLGMDEGKMCLECGNAALDCYQKAMNRHPIVLKKWEREGEPTVIVQPNTTGEEVLYDMVIGIERRMPNPLICVMRDEEEGFNEGEVTAIGFGPDFVYVVDRMVGNLKRL